MARAAEQPIDPQVASILANPKVIAKLGKGIPGFDRAGLLAGIFAALAQKQGIDGQNALAQVMVDELFAARPGAMSRTRILDSICRLLNWHSDDVHAQPVEEMSEDELRSAIASSLPGLRMAVIARPRKPRRPVKHCDDVHPRSREKLNTERFRLAVGQEVRDRREAKGWKMAELAMRSNCHKVDINMLETGRRFLTEVKMARVAEALGVTVGDWKRGQFSPDPMPSRNGEVIPEPEEDLEAGMDEPCEPDL